jgi:hypothetical protein
LKLRCGWKGSVNIDDYQVVGTATSGSAGFQPFMQ